MGDVRLHADGLAEDLRLANARIKALEKRLDDIETIAVNNRSGCITCANVVLLALAGKGAEGG